MMPSAFVLFWLVCGHFVMDFPLQGSTIAAQKSPLPGGARNEVLAKAVPWPYWMTTHALMHGGTVTLVTGSLLLGVLETGIHWVTDLAKCQRKIGIHLDQGIHLVCKVAWLVAWQRAGGGGWHLA
jgi:hypothetical protein